MRHFNRGERMYFSRRIITVFFSLLFLLSLSVGYQNALANGTSALVETQWLADNLKNPSVCIVHVAGFSPQSLQDFQGKHVLGAVYLDVSDIMGVIGDGSKSPDAAKFEAAMNKLGIKNDSQVVVYGSGGDNPLVTTAFWLMKYFGHSKVNYLNGGLAKWTKEKRETTNQIKSETSTKYKASPNESTFANADYVLKNIGNPKAVIVDVRAADEYKGLKSPVPTKIMGHIKGAVNLEFAETNLNKDGTFKSVSDLKTAYEARGVTKDKEAIVYCLGGVRASHTIFVLKYLLGYPNVRNYVGSWGEWGNRLDPAKYPSEK